MYTWKLDESADFIERASVLVNEELAVCLDSLQSNCSEITTIASGWSRGPLDVFSEHQDNACYSIEQLKAMHR